jgi:hypothetical protein
LVASNLMQVALAIVNARLIRPKASGEVLQTMALIASPRGSSRRNVIGGRSMGEVSVIIMLRGAWRRAAMPVRADLGIVDQYGTEHGVRVPLKPFPQPTEIANHPAAGVRKSA